MARRRRSGAAAARDPANPVILVDTSVWIDHLRGRDRKLMAHLLDGRVAGHPFVIGELTVGSLREGSEVLSLLATLPAAPVISHADMLAFIDADALMGLVAADPGPPPGQGGQSSRRRPLESRRRPACDDSGSLFQIVEQQAVQLGGLVEHDPVSGTGNVFVASGP